MDNTDRITFQNEDIDNVIKFLHSQTATTQNKDVVLKSIARLSDNLRREGKLTEENKNKLMEEVENRIVNN